LLVVIGIIYVMHGHMNIKDGRLIQHLATQLNRIGTQFCTFVTLLQIEDRAISTIER